MLVLDTPSPSNDVPNIVLYPTSPRRRTKPSVLHHDAPMDVPQSVRRVAQTRFWGLDFHRTPIGSLTRAESEEGLIALVHLVNRLMKRTEVRAIANRLRTDPKDTLGTMSEELHALFERLNLPSISLLASVHFLLTSGFIVEPGHQLHIALAVGSHPGIEALANDAGARFAALAATVPAIIRSETSDECKIEAVEKAARDTSRVVVGELNRSLRRGRRHHSARIKADVLYLNRVPDERTQQTIGIRPLAQRILDLQPPILATNDIESARNTLSEWIHEMNRLLLLAPATLP